MLFRGCRGLQIPSNVRIGLFERPVGIANPLQREKSNDVMKVVVIF